MRRTTWVYLLTIVASVVALWAILKLGSTLPAAPDVSGTWRIVPEDPSKPTDRVIARFGDTLRIDQSGRYLQVHFATGQTVDLRAIDAPEPQPGVPRTLRATDGTWTIAFRPQKSPSGPATPGAPPETELLVLVEKPEPYSFTAVRPAAAGPR